MLRHKLTIFGNFLTPAPTGVQRYGIEITRELALQNPGRVELVASPAILVTPRLEGVPLRRISCLGRLGGRFPGWAFFDAPIRLRFGWNDSYIWNPSNIGAPHLPNQLLTLHDLCFLRNPEFFSRSFALKHRIATALTLPRVKALFTVSKTVQDEIGESFPYWKGRVGVVYNGVSDAFSVSDSNSVEQVRKKYRTTRPYLLTVGSHDPRKNLRRLIEAYVRANLFSRGYDLLLAGGKFGSFRGDPHFDQLIRSPGVRALGYIDDKDLPPLYTGAAAFVFPSVYEGFGIPLIEASKCGCPVVCSDIPVFREIMGDQAKYFDPFSVSSMAQSLDEFLNQPPPLRIVRGTSFSWQNSAATMSELINRLPKL